MSWVTPRTRIRGVTAALLYLTLTPWVSAATRDVAPMPHVACPLLIRPTTDPPKAKKEPDSSRGWALVFGGYFVVEGPSALALF